MRCKFSAIIGIMTAGVLLVGVSVMTAPANAQSTSALGGVGESQTISARAKVRAVDMKTRDVTLVGPSGDVFTVHAGDAVQNLAQLKPGQTVVINYYASVAYVLSKPGANTPENLAIIAAARTEKGQLPGGVVAEKSVVTGMVVSVDMASHKLQLVNPTGGKIVTINVKDPQRQKDLAMVKVGDKLTTVITQALAIGIEPSK